MPFRLAKDSLTFEEQGSTPSAPTLGNQLIYPTTTGWAALRSTGSPITIGGRNADNYPVRVTYFAHDFVWQRTPTTVVGAGYQYAMIQFNTQQLSGEELYVEFPFRQGAATLKMLGATSNTYGTLGYYLSNPLTDDPQIWVGSINWYSASTVLNVQKTMTITVPYSGLHRLTLKLDPAFSGATSLFTIQRLTIYLQGT
jgi:hypothetical protein